MQSAASSAITFCRDGLQCFHRGWQHRDHGSPIMRAVLYLHHSFTEAGWTQKLHKLLQNSASAPARCDHIDLQCDTCWKPKVLADGIIPYDLMSTRGMVTTISQHADANAVKPAVKQLCNVWLNELADAAVTMLRKSGLGHTAVVDGIDIVMSPQGLVAGPLAMVFRK